ARAESRAAGGGERRDWAVLFDEDAAQLTAEPEEDGLRLEIDGEPARLEGARPPGGTPFEGRFDGGAVSVRVEEDGAGWLLSFRGAQAKVRAVSPRVAEFARLMPKKAPPDTSKVLLSPMPGLLVSLAVAEGEEVEAGQALAVVEAMKMENVLRAERPGRVKSIPTAAGDNLAADQPILYFE
ncbi:MAG: biotin/lipoyl-binding protein, partial [Alphaproteobacteria bacterium]|nr:biotin/lipoyl-binding protein [Alphaproteobacteria bacterium]